MWDFTDLAEPTEIYNSHWVNASGKSASKRCDSLYREVIAIDGYRDIKVNSRLGFSCLVMELPVEKITKVESARRLESSEYVLESEIGFISLKTAL